MPVDRDHLERISSGLAYSLGQIFCYTGKDGIRVISDNGYEAYGEVDETDGNTYEWYIQFSDDRSHVKPYASSCTCPSFSKQPGLCKHLVAAVLKLEGYGTDEDAAHVAKLIVSKKLDSQKLEIARKAVEGASAAPSMSAMPRLRTREFDKDLIMMYANREYSHASIASATAPTHDPLTIEPTIRWDDYEGVRVVFRIGAGKLFVVKNVGELKNAIAAGATMQFGTKTKFSMARDNFTEKSKPLVDFIHMFAESKKGYDFSAESRKEIDLRGAAVDMFFDAYDSDTIKLEYRRGYWTKERSKVRITKSNPRFPITVVRIDGGIKIISEALSGAGIIRGKSSCCIICDGADELFVTDASYADACYFLFAELSMRRLVYADADVAAFFNLVMNRVEPYSEVRYTRETGEDTEWLKDIPRDGAVYDDLYGIAHSDVPEEPTEEDREGIIKEIENLMPPSLVTKAFFDIEDDDSVSVRMLHCYGKTEIPAFGEKDLNRNHDFVNELRAENILLAYVPDAVKSSGGHLTISSEHDIFRLLSEGLPELASCCEIYTSEPFDGIKVRPPAVVTVGVSVSGSLLDIDIDVEGIDFKDLAMILSQYRKKKKYTRLTDGSFLPIDDGDAIAQLAELSEGTEISEKALSEGHVSLSLENAMYVDAILKGSEALRYKRDESFRAIIRALRNVDDADIEMPAELAAVLRNYQVTGVKWLSVITELGFGGILADDMGLGKTIQLLAYLKRRKDSGSAVPSIVICPASLVLNWAAEAERFTPELLAVPLTGSKSERMSALNAWNADLYITSYGQMMRDVGDLSDKKFGCAILDEAQFIKNQTTKSARAVKSISADIRLALTGTPVENTLAELWSIFDFVSPGYLNTYGHFRSRYEVPIAKNKDEQSTRRLRALTSPFIMRRMKADVLKELPEKVETVLLAQMESKQRKVYTAMLAQVNAELAERLEEVAGQQRQMVILAAMTRLRQICCDPSLLYENYDGGSAKLESCMELLESCIESGHRVLLFSQFTSMLAIIRKQLDVRGFSYYYLDGATPKRERMELMSSFNERDDAKIFLISLKAGGTGLNLTGADIVIHYDPWWNISVQNQATDRAHRIGQKNRVQVYSMVAKDTIEEKIIELQKKKAALAKSVIEGESAFERLTDEELLSLLKER
ncbi:MAG: DEAD/DEAH box helicase [Clostridiales Family XIII bacterium]|jgi:superfamily II DNA or RNA helicase|nr:DEAD/DEAH box helicase [Clostridiales Family XIII bacterium]